MRNTDSIKVKKSWREVSVNDYYKIKDVLEDKALSSTERDIAILALLSDADEDTIWSMNVNDVRELLAKTKWANSFKMDKHAPKTITVNGKRYDVRVDMEKFTVAQYVDFQSFFKKRPRRDYIGNVLACLIIPHGCRYADNYDIKALAQELPEQLDILSCEEILSFFAESCLLSIQATLISLELMKKKTMKKQAANKEQIAKEMDNLKKTILDGWQWLLQ